MTLYFLFYWWQRNHSKKNSWANASVNISNTRFTRFHCSNRDSQFIFILWKSLCKRLSINLQLITVYHLQIDDQSEQVNQNVERYFQFFCLYMQNDWAKLLLMIEFVDNNALFSVIFLIFFFLNKDFYSRMNFKLNTCQKLS